MSAEPSQTSTDSNDHDQEEQQLLPPPILHTAGNSNKEDKTHTFRKRRLSLTTKTVATTENEQIVEESKPRQRDTSPTRDEHHDDHNARVEGEVYGDNKQDEEVDYGYGEDQHPHEAEPDYGDNGGKGDLNIRHDLGDNHSHHSAHSSEADEKAHTFRQRRLSLTTTSQGGSANSSVANDQNEKESGSKTQIVAPDQFHLDPNPRKRRLSQDSSICSVNSDTSNHGSPQRRSLNNPMMFVSRTLHAGELLPQQNCGMPPPSPVVNADNILYHQNPLPPLQQLFMQQQAAAAAGLLIPNNSTNGGGTSNQPQLFFRPQQQGLPPLPSQPKWKRRKTWCHETETHKLPFAVDIVGTYSCHGVEPVYDSEYEDEDEDISGPAITMAAKINQDRGGIAYPYGNHPQTALFAVYDGHGQGGELVSQYALHEIQRRLEKHPMFKQNLEIALKDTFMAVDEALKQEPLIEPLFAGTTACVAVYQSSTLTLANAGDSRAVLAQRRKRIVRRQRLSMNEQQQQPSIASDSEDDADDAEEQYDGGYVAVNLTQDQNPDVPAEMHRILSMGGYVSLPPAPGLSARVWLDPHCTQIGLAMARSIGDHAVAEAGVIAEPVVTQHEVTADDEFLILASDGVWEFISSEQAVQIVGENLYRGATKACQALIEASAARWHEEEGAYRDDITAIVVRLQNLWDNHHYDAPNPSTSNDSPKKEDASTSESNDLADKQSNT